MKSSRFLRLLITAWGVLLVGIAISPLIFGIKQGLGDTLFAESMAQSLFLEGGKWSDWAVTPSPAYVPDLVVYFIGFFLFDFPADRILFVCFIQALLLVTFSYYLIQRLTPSVSPHTLLWIFMFVALLAFMAATSRIWFFFDSTNNHFGAFLFAIWSLIVTLSLIKNSPSWRGLCLSTLLTAVGILNGQLYLIWWCVPGGLTALLLAGVNVAWSRQRRDSLGLLCVLGSIIAGAGIASYLRPIVTPWDSLALVGRARFQLTNLITGQQNLAFALQALLTPIRIDFLIVYLFIVVGFSVIVWHCVRLLVLTHDSGREKIFADEAEICEYSIRSPAHKLDMASRFWVLFGLLCLVITTVGTLYSGEFREGLSFRYYLMPLYVAVITACVLLFENSTSRAWRKLWLVALWSVSGVLGCGMIWFYPLLKPRPVSLQQARTYAGTVESQVAGCLDANRARYSLRDGVSDFWMARPIMLLSKTKQHVVPIKGGNFEPYHYMSNVTWFLGGENARVRNPIYNYVVVNGFSESDVRKLYGNPTDIFHCGSTRIPVMVFDEQSTGFDTKIKQQFRRFLLRYDFNQRRTDVLRFSPMDLMLEVGKIHNGAAVSKPGEMGWFFIGPYMPLSTGSYTVSIKFKAQGVAGSAILGIFEVFSNPNHSFAHLPITVGAEIRTEQLTFSIDSSQTSLPIEFRLRSWGQGTIEVSELELKRN